MKIKKYAAIDIGSNAIRVLISNVIETKEGVHFQKNALVRAPIRLGEDSFTFGEISKKSLKRMVNAMKAFKLLMKVHHVLSSSTSLLPHLGCISFSPFLHSKAFVHSQCYCRCCYVAATTTNLITATTTTREQAPGEPMCLR